MDTLQNLRAFLAVSKAGSFSAAARKMGVATSVVAKRIDQLEAATGTRLFERTTRSMHLSDAGQDWIRRVQSLVADLDDVMAGLARKGQELGGPLRVKVPTTMTILYLADIFARFQQLNPKIVLEVILTDRVVNPVDEGFDVVVAALSASFNGVVDQPLCPMRRLLCASPAYLEQRGVPQHPRELTGHDTLSFQPTGHVWSFGSAQGPIQVEVSPKVSANDGQVLLAAAQAGNGIALLSEYVVLPSLRCGTLVSVLEDFPVPELWLKALIPDSRFRVSRVRALIEFMKDNFVPPPWERGIGRS